MTMIQNFQKSLWIIPIILLSCSKSHMDESDLQYLNSLIDADSIEIFEQNGDVHINIHEAEHEKIKDMFDSSPIIAHAVHVSLNKDRSSFDSKSYCVVEFFTGNKIAAKYRIRNDDLARAGNMIRSFNKLIDKIIDFTGKTNVDLAIDNDELLNRLKSDLNISEFTSVYVNTFEIDDKKLSLFVQIGEKENLKSYVFYYHPRLIELVDFAEIDE